MTKWILFIAGLLIISSCSQQEEVDSRLVDSEWIYTGPDMLFDSLDIGLSFQGDSLFTTSDRGLFMRGRYYLSKTKLEVYSKDTIDWIVSVTQDSLTILKNNKAFKYYNKNLEFDPGLQYSKISLRTGLCFGGCQSFNIVLDDKGNVEFQGLKNGSVINERHYVMDRQTRNEIDSLFKATQIAKIDSSKFYGWFDDWDMTLKIEYGDKERKAIKGTRGYMPYRLKPIIGTLINDLRKRALIK